MTIVIKIKEPDETMNDVMAALASDAVDLYSGILFTTD
jgi:hypothetical protein